MNLFEVKRTYNNGRLFLNEDAIDSVRCDEDRGKDKYYVLMRSGIEYQLIEEDFNRIIKIKK